MRKVKNILIFIVIIFSSIVYGEDSSDGFTFWYYRQDMQTPFIISLDDLFMEDQDGIPLLSEEEGGGAQ